MVLRPILKPIQRKILRPIFAAAQRIFITANPVLETHFPLENTKTLTGNFRVGALCVLPTSATTVTLFGQLASASNYIKILSTGFASISIGGSVVTSTVLATKDSKLRIYDVKLSGNDFLFQENGVTIDTVTDAGAAANSLVIDVLCQSNGADFFDGTYADPKITDLTTPSNSVAWQLNLATGNTEPAIGGGNDLTYNNAPDSTRELFTFNQSDNQWENAFFPNLLLRSEELDDAAWFKSGSTISANVITAPDGNETMDKIVENSSTSEHVAGQNVTLPDNTDHTASFFVSKEGRDFAFLRHRSKSNAVGRTFYDLVNVTVGTQSGSHSNATIEQVGSNLYSITITFDSLTGATTPDVQVGPAQADNVANYLGDGSSGIGAWGAQLVEGLKPLDYKKTADIVGRSIEVA